MLHKFDLGSNGIFDRVDYSINIFNINYLFIENVKFVAFNEGRNKSYRFKVEDLIFRFSALGL